MQRKQVQYFQKLQQENFINNAWNGSIGTCRGKQVQQKSILSST